jgi:hypothetical protein
MANLGTVYDAEPAVRTVDDIIADPDTGEQDTVGRSNGPRARSKWLTGSVNDTCSEVITAVFDQAEHRDPGHRRTWVALVDGAPHQIALINEQAAARDVQVHIVIDIIHVLEYLWSAAHALHPGGGKDIEAWVARTARTILAGDALTAAETITTAATNAGIAPGGNKGIDDAVAYLTNKVYYLRHLPPPGQRQNRHHRSPLGTTRRPSHPHPPSPQHQRRLRRLLGLARTTGVHPQPPGPIPQPPHTHRLITQTPSEDAHPPGFAQTIPTTETQCHVA